MCITFQQVSFLFSSQKRKSVNHTFGLKIEDNFDFGSSILETLDLVLQISKME